MFSPTLLTAPFRVLPDFVIIGAQKCGTTTLYNTLTRHPSVGAASRKEVHFFDNEHDRGALWYRSHFPLAFERWRHRHAGLKFVAGEASPYYLFHPHAPARCQALLPETRLIAILRNPVDRAYSHYHHAVRRGFETLPFEEAIEKEDDRVSGEHKRMLADPHYVSSAHQHFSYVSRGFYLDQLCAWLRVFPREQLLVVQLSDLHRQPAPTWTCLFEFLGIEPRDLGVPPRWGRATYEPLDPRMRNLLRERFQQPNARLYEWLGRDLGWE